MAENKLTKWLYIIFSVKWWILGALGGTFLLIGGTWTLVNTPKMRDVVKGFVHFCEEIFPNFTFAQGIVLAVFGLVVIIFAAYEMMQHYISVAYPRGKRSYYRTKVLQKGPKIVVIGGGSGHEPMFAFFRTGDDFVGIKGIYMESDCCGKCRR